jgi:hypothetical protein
VNCQLFISIATVNNLYSGIQSEKPAHKIISSVYQVVDEFLSLFPLCVVTVNSDRCVRPARVGFALLKHGQLFAQEVIPGSEPAPWTQGRPEEGGPRSPGGAIIVLTPPMAGSILPYRGVLRDSEVIATLRINKIQLSRATREVSHQEPDSPGPDSPESCSSC